MTRFGCSYTELLSKGWNHAWRLVSEIVRDHFSHTVASVQGWLYVPRPEEAQLLDWVDIYRRLRRGKGQVMPRPIPRPWMGLKRAEPPTALSAEQLALRNKLKERFEIGGQS